MATIELSDYRTCEAALKQSELKQSLYDQGAIVMDQVLVNLHGEEHRTRRLAEMRVFRRDFFRRYEQDVIPAIFAEVMAGIDPQQDVDLVELGYRFMVYLAMNFAGIDLRERSTEEFDELIRMLRTFGMAATLGQSKTSAAEQASARTDIAQTLQAFDERFFTPSAQRRKDLLAQVDAGELNSDELPMDVLTVLLQQQTALAMARDMMLRETAFYFLAGAHTSVHSLSHAMDHLLNWIEAHPEQRSALVNDRDLVQRFVHESFRLHPSSPVSKRRALAPVTFLDGQRAEPEDTVIINLRMANRDPEIFGSAAAEFIGERSVPPGIAETGITFGIGMHSCLGKNLAAGVLAIPGRDTPVEKRQYGTVPWIAHALLQAGVQRSPDRPGELDATIERETWLRYPVQFPR
ncbi:MAG: cytochrome P450 [Pseudomonadales bacterium]